MQNKPLKKVLTIVGPTASGKTSLAIELAKEINGEIISLDSRQVFKGMAIGTAQPTKRINVAVMSVFLPVCFLFELYILYNHLVLCK